MMRISRGYSARCRWLGRCLLLLGAVLIVPQYWTMTGGDTDRSPTTFLLGSDSPVGYVVGTPGCQIPDLNVLDNTIKEYVKPMTAANLSRYCQLKPSLVTASRMNSTHTALRVQIKQAVHWTQGNVTTDDVQCWLHEITRTERGDSYRYVDHPLPFSRSGELLVTGVDHGRVRCSLREQIIYTDFFSFIWDKGRHDKPAEERLSVLLLVVDSVSRLNFHRMLPTTSTLLLDTMSAVQMFGFNKNGDNTLPIMSTVLMGMSLPEVKTSCHGQNGDPFDPCPFIWKKFSDRGYTTAFGEDAVIIHSFNTDQGGFRKQPTDYYLRPMLLAEYDAYERTPWDKSDYICFNKNRWQDVMLLEWMTDFLHVTADRTSFGYIHLNGFTHDDMNWAQLLDPYLHSALSNAYNANIFNRTAVIVMADHGMRFGEFRQTFQGRLEENLPALFVAFPDWFRQRYPHITRTLSSNSRRLITGVDIHRTLLDLVDADYRLLDSRLRLFWEAAESLERGKPSKKPVSPEIQSAAGSYLFGTAPRPAAISLLRPISPWRTCTDVQLPPNWCTCQQTYPVHRDHPMVREAAIEIVRWINNLTAPERSLCSPFQLSSVKESRSFLTGYTSRSTSIQDLQQDLMVTAVLEPGGAVFEAVVRVAINSSGTLTSTQLLQEASRVNAYRTQSHCIKRWELRKYCYCYTPAH